MLGAGQAFRPLLREMGSDGEFARGRRAWRAGEWPACTSQLTPPLKGASTPGSVPL